MILNICILFALCRCFSIHTQPRIPARIIIHHRVIRTVCVQVQPISAVYILLQEPSEHRVVKSCPKVILSGDSIIYLSCISQAIGYISRFLQDISKGVIAVRLPDLVRLIQQEQGASRLVLNKGKTALLFSILIYQEQRIISSYIMVLSIFPSFLRQFAPVEEKADDFPVFFRLITQIFSVIAVELDKTLLPYISGAA